MSYGFNSPGPTIWSVRRCELPETIRNIPLRMLSNDIPRAPSLQVLIGMWQEIVDIVNDVPAKDVALGS